MALKPGKSSRVHEVMPSPLRRTLALGIGPMLFAGLFSLVSNLLYLALPIYTNQIYSRVLSSQSVSTLVVLTLGAAFVFIISSIVDHFREQVLSGFGAVFDQQVASHVFSALFDAVVRRQGTRAQALRDLDTVRQAISGSAVNVLFDLPWMPVFLLMLFIVDPLIGVATLVGGVILVILAVLQDRATHGALKTANNAALQSYSFTDAALRNGEVVRALGMLPRLGSQWASFRQLSISAGAAAGERASFYSGAIRYVRMLIQILIIALGAYLVVERTIPSGLLFANMILAARALAPIERIVASWKGLFESAQAFRRLEAALEDYEPPVPLTQLPVPQGRLTVENVNFAPAGAPALVLVNLTFGILPGEMVGVIGPSGAGKSTLARLLVGIWKPVAGSVRLDGADVYSWDREDFGRHVAYQPQDTELFSGTVRNNIARFRADVDDADVIRAAQAAGAHDLILRLPNGYDTELGEGGAILSAGQRQRVGLARTLFGDPKLVVLDEPNANLDQEGEKALNEAILSLKARGATIVMISHKPSAFQHADKLLVLQNGKISMYGPREDVMQQLSGARPRPPLAEVKG
ncbi:type I secretion system permease/ATPase [Sphingomonas sp. PR090111-T3T-6A]|uniref:type I secretion system permease/ATPase n=1 Tax=Sphingomonas sp. PR090111-T3T-6A TaxID=685778 RepID=UPI0003A80CE5|nr:type I secretion system permease/ATPase [Sphingomonas sp. PR090111-T3T-6A]